LQDTPAIDRLHAIELELIDLDDDLANLEPVPEHVDHNDKWCVYLCVHPIGFYYYGKGITANVLSGAYKGSGTSLRAAWEWYPKDEWYAHVLQTFPELPLNENNKDPGELEAYTREKEIVTFDMLCDPFCLNDVPGGKGGWSWGRLSARVVDRRKKAVAKSWEDPEIRERHRLGNVAHWSSDAAREKHRERVRHAWLMRRNSESYQEQIQETELRRQMRAASEKEKKLKGRVKTMAKAAASISEKAIERARAKREANYSASINLFEQCASRPVVSHDKVLKPRETLALHGSTDSHQLRFFIDWLDDHAILRWGGESHKLLIANRELDRNARRVELERQREKIFKLSPETRQKMRDRQLSHQKRACPHCGGDFRPACFGRYHGDKCKVANQGSGLVWAA
jgi:hypothetical protein